MDFFDQFQVKKQPQVQEPAVETKPVDTEDDDSKIDDINDKEPKEPVKPAEPAEPATPSSSDDNDEGKDDNLDSASEEELLKLRDEKLAEISEKKEEDRTTEEKEFYQEHFVEEDTYGNLIKTLADDAVLSLKEGKEYKGEDGFKDVIKDNIEAGIEAYKDTFDPETKRYLNFLENGGKREDYVADLFEEDYATVDTTNKSNQKLLVEDLYKLNGYSNEDIRDRIELLEENGKLEKESELAKGILSKNQEDKRAAKLESQTEAANTQREANAKKIAQFEEAVMGLEEIQGFPVTKKEKEELFTYMVKPIKDGKSQYMLDSADLTSRITQAFLTKKKFKFEDLEKKVASKKTSELRKSLDKLGTKKFKNISKGGSSAAGKGGAGPTQTPKIIWEI